MNIKRFGSYVACGLLAVSVGSLALPRHVSVERAATVKIEPGKVLALAASNQGFQTFNPYRTRDPELQIELFGPNSGVGSGFHFDSKDGTGSQTVAAVSAQTVTYAIDLGPMGQPVQSISAVPDPAGSRVVWRMDADMGFNPLFRVMGLFMDGAMGPTLQLGLENLAATAA